IVPDAELGELPRRLDTLIVPGGSGQMQAGADAEAGDWVAQASAHAARAAAVCTGAFVGARAGVLDGRRAATRGAFAERLAGEHPAVTVDPEPIYVRDGDIWTSAGVTAGIDLSLALVEQDHDRDTALLIARHLVMFLRRPGSQAQFSATL